MTQAATMQAPAKVPSLDTAEAFIVEKHQLFIDGRWVAATLRRDVRNIQSGYRQGDRDDRIGRKRGCRSRGESGTRSI